MDVSKIYRYSYQAPPQIIHRSGNRIIIAGDNIKSSQQEDGLLRGWKAPMDRPYRALGVFQRVVPVIEELKAQLDHSLELSTEAQKAINKIKRNPEGLYRDAEEPLRTWNTISRGVVSI